MRGKIAHRQPHADLADAAPPGRDQGHSVAVRVGEAARLSSVVAGVVELAVAGGRALGQRLGQVVDLDHRAQRIVPVLVLPAADRQQMVEGKADLALPERQHRFEVVGREAEVHARLGEIHAKAFQKSVACAAAACMTLERSFEKANEARRAIEEEL